MENKVKYKIVDEKSGIHEYTLVVKEKTDRKIYTLKTSKESVWSDSFKNTKLIKIVDTGNGSIIMPLQFNIDDMADDYAGTGYLYLILDCMHKLNDNLQPNYKIIKSKK